MTETGDRDDLGIEGLGPGFTIGQGGSAVVYRARQDELDRDVAVKVLGGVVDDDTRRRFDRERRLMGRLSQHEGMVTVYQTGFTTQNEPFIVMPLLGQSLDDEIKQQPMTWERATEIIADVCRTVGFAHEQEIVHRDLKPGNIMMSTSGRALVADFGIARIVDSKTNLEATALTLTPAYSPPEALETTVADPSSDVYSLGATLFALIAGHPPYCAPGDDRTLMTLMHSIIADPVPQLGASAPEEVQAVLDRAMAKLPQDRYQTADEMADALEAAVAAATARLAHESADTVIVPPAVVPPGPPDTPGTEPSRRRILVAVGVVIALLLAAGVVLAQSGGGGDDVASPVATDGVDGAASATDPDDASDGEETDAEGSVAAAAGAASTVVPTTDEVLVVEGGEVFLLPFDEPGAGAFTRSFAALSTESLQQFVDAGGVSPASVTAGDDPTAGGDSSGDGAGSGDGANDGSTSVAVVAGTTEGTFAGSQGVAPCAPEELVDSLDPDAPETAAWAEVQEIDIEMIPMFVDGLTATVLTADTRVTDHRFVDGEAISSQAVLQVGSAVLIDEFGAPQVLCSSGSPLAPPEAVEGTTRYVGTAWDTFEPATTVAVLAAPDPVEEFVLTDVAGGDAFIRPVGSSGAADRPLLPGEVLATGEITSFADEGLAFLTTNEVTLIFRPEGGEVSGTFSLVFAFDGQGSIDSTGDLTGTYDVETGEMTGTGFGTVTGGGVLGSLGAGGSSEGSWSATVDPAAGIISGSFEGDAAFELTFTPYST